VDLAVGQRALVEQLRNVPALRQNVDFRRRAQIGEERPCFNAPADRDDRGGKVVDQRRAGLG